MFPNFGNSEQMATEIAATACITTKHGSSYRNRQLAPKGTLNIAWFLGHMNLLPLSPLNEISASSAIFVGLISDTNIQTDHAMYRQA